MRKARWCRVGRCKECDKVGVSGYTFWQVCTSQTLVHVPRTFDENGREVMLTNPNRTTTTYECSMGHKWSETV